MDIVRMYEASPDKDKFLDFVDWASVHLKRKADAMKELGIE